MSPELYESKSAVDPLQRRAISHGGCVVWFTGLSGSGKSTVAHITEKRLIEEGILSYCLDGDNVRLGLNSDLGFSAGDREENIRRISCLSALFEDAGLVCLVCAISPFEASRLAAKNRCKKFLTVYVKASVEVCAGRDVKGLYKKAAEGKIPDFTGISSPYEIPENPDVILDTVNSTACECAELIITKIKELLDG